MLYIDKNFDIFKTKQDTRLQPPYFECDELFAPIISILNRKGYKTKSCCSGHIINEIPFSKNSFSLLYDYAYIIFDKKYDFPQIPIHARIEDNNNFAIIKPYNLQKDLFKQQLTIARDYYNWAKNLPPKEIIKNETI